MPTESKAFLELPVVLGFGPATGPTLKTALCHIHTLVGRRINIGEFFALLCVLWWGALDWPTPQALTLFGGVGFIARRPEKGTADGV